MPTLRRRSNETVPEALAREQERRLVEAARLRKEAAQRREVARGEALRVLNVGAAEARKLEQRAVQREREAEIAGRQAARLGEAAELIAQASAQEAVAADARARHEALVAEAGELGGRLEAVQVVVAEKAAEVEALTDDGRIDDAAGLERDLGPAREEADGLARRLGQARAGAEEAAAVALEAVAAASALRERTAELRVEARAAREELADEERRAAAKRELDEQRRQAAPAPAESPAELVPVGGGWYASRRNGMRFRF